MGKTFQKKNKTVEQLKVSLWLGYNIFLRNKGKGRERSNDYQSFLNFEWSWMRFTTRAVHETAKILVENYTTLQGED